MAKRVVITGLGAVSCAGLGADKLWHAARAGQSGALPFHLERAGPQLVKIAAHLPDYDASPILGQKLAASLDRFSSMALVAAHEACTHAGIFPGEADERCGVLIGSGIGGGTSLETGFQAFYSQTRLDPMTVPKVMPSAAASHVSMRFGARGPCLCIATACASATQAIGIGGHLVRSGAIDMAIVGGAEAPLSNASFRAWEILRVLSPVACRPFSRDRDGMMLGEGAAVLVLESEKSARARGAAILCEFAGYGTSSDAMDLLRPDPAGAARAMNAAIVDSGLTPADIGYVNAHGTGTLANDIAEVAALKQIFGNDLAATPFSSTKPIHGHALGASGAFELVLAVNAIREQIVPPNINWLGPDPKCVVEPVLEARPAHIEAALSNSFAFGGINASIVLRRMN